MVDFISPMWKDSLHFVEPNMSGIGGLAWCQAEQIVGGTGAARAHTLYDGISTSTSARTSASC